MYRRSIIVVCSVFVLGCSSDTVTEPTQHLWLATLQGEAGWEHLSGEASVLMSVGGSQFEAAAVILGDEPGAVRPWHVHFNDCATGGGIVGADGDYPRLNVGGDGTAETSVFIGQTLNPNANYHVNVHLSNEQLATIIMCGDLILQP